MALKSPFVGGSKTCSDLQAYPMAHLEAQESNHPSMEKESIGLMCIFSVSKFCFSKCLVATRQLTEWQIPNRLAKDNGLGGDFTEEVQVEVGGSASGLVLSDLLFQNQSLLGKTTDYSS